MPSQLSRLRGPSASTQRCLSRPRVLFAGRLRDIRRVEGLSVTTLILLCSIVFSRRDFARQLVAGLSVEQVLETTK